MYLTKIKRETSKYNKYMKWRVIGISEETNAQFILYYKTLDKARKSINTDIHKLIEIDTGRAVWKDPKYK